MFEQTIGWLGNIFFLISGILLTKKNPIGWYGQFLANVLYVWQSILLNNPSLMWLSVILGLVNLYGVWEWNKKDIIKFNDAEKAYAEAVCNLYDDLPYEKPIDDVFTEDGMCTICQKQGRYAIGIGWYCINKECGDCEMEEF
jgi:hypothetical protein